MGSTAHQSSDGDEGEGDAKQIHETSEDFPPPAEEKANKEPEEEEAGFELDALFDEGGQYAQMSDEAARQPQAPSMDDIAPRGEQVR